MRMVDLESRMNAGLLLRRLASGRLTNDEFDEAYPSWSRDRGVRNISEFAWSLYSDYHTHRLLGRHALTPETRRIAARCVLFLHSGVEYEWPDPPRIRLGAELRQFLTLGLWPSGYRRAFDEWQKSIDTQLWPFASATDVQQAATTRPFFLPKSRV
jgi:hypothetical protein